MCARSYDKWVIYDYGSYDVRKNVICDVCRRKWIRCRDSWQMWRKVVSHWCNYKTISPINQPEGCVFLCTRLIRPYLNWLPSRHITLPGRVFERGWRPLQRNFWLHPNEMCNTLKEFHSCPNQYRVPLSVNLRYKTEEQARVWII